MSVSNGLDVPVQVRVRAPLATSQLSIGNSNSVVTIRPQTIQVVRMPVRSATLSSTLIRLQLTTKYDTPLGTTQSLS